MSALSEVLWSPAANKDYNGFAKRMATQFGRYRLWGANFSKTFYDLQATVLPAKQGGLVWELKTQLPQAQIIYSENSIDSIAFTGSKRYTGPVKIDHTATWYAVELQSGKPYGKTITQPFFINKATGKPISLKTRPSDNYPGEGGARGLVNGIVSQKGAGAPEWLEWEGGDMEATIDLGRAQPVSNIACHLLEVKGSRIYLPAYMEVLVSGDGVLFQPVGKSSDYHPGANGMYTCVLAIAPLQARYVKVIAKNIGVIPNGERGAGGPARLFADEIQID